MKKLLLGVGALLMASAAVPASAQGWNGYSGDGNSYGNNYGDSYGGGYSDIVRQHVRACRKHERFHERLAEEHDQFHDQGYYGGDNHADEHDELADEHDAYHDRHGGARNCSYWYAQYYNLQRYRTYDRYDRGYRW
jgi:hypothetical protein